jgi:hypothetical protein
MSNCASCAAFFNSLLTSTSTFWVHDPGKDIEMEDHPGTKGPNESGTNYEITQLRREVDLLAESVARIEIVLTKGFDTISAQLEPLRDLHRFAQTWIQSH